MERDDSPNGVSDKIKTLARQAAKRYRDRI